MNIKPIIGLLAITSMGLSAVTQAQTWNFTTCGTTGADGPTQGACDTAYNGTTLESAVSVSGGIQTWTAPASGTYVIEAAGASGGDSNGGPNGDFVGGAGARVLGEFELTAGDTLQILVGQEGTTPPSDGDGPLGGGGGGSFVWRSSDDQLLLAAGGGGGAGDGFSSADANGAAATAGETGSLVTGLSACVTLAATGEGWQSSNYTCGGEFSGGGAGWNSIGEGNFYGCSTTPSDALHPAAGGTGGAGNADDLATGPGGFGGGGGSAVQCGSTGGGGGGGYTGGAGVGCSAATGCGPGGGGAGSFNAGLNPQGFDGDNEGDGAVIIRLASAATTAAQPVPAVPTAGLATLTLAVLLFAALGLRRRNTA